MVIRFQEKGSLFGRQPDKKLQVMIPRSLASDLREVQADAVSANIRIEKLEAEKITCTATSGAVALTGLQAESRQRRYLVILQFLLSKRRK